MAPKTSAISGPPGSVPKLANPAGSARHDSGSIANATEHDEDEHGGHLDEDQPLERDVDDRRERQRDADDEQADDGNDRRDCRRTDNVASVAELIAHPGHRFAK